MSRTVGIPPRWPHDYVEEALQRLIHLPYGNKFRGQAIDFLIQQADNVRLSRAERDRIMDALDCAELRDRNAKP